MPTFRIHHITKYEYDRPVKESMNEIKIFPFANEIQEVLSQDLVVTGNPDVQYFTDYWGNKTGVFNIMAPHRELVIESKLKIRTHSTPPAFAENAGDFDLLEKEVSSNLRLLELSTAEQIQHQERIEQIGAQIFNGQNSVAAVVEACSTYIFKCFKYIKGITSIESTVDEILEHKSGVCQDFAHLMLQILRSLKIPSRYVSGYICPNKNGMRGEGATHAWVEAYIPGYGWAGIDPTNNVWATGSHIKLAVGRHFSDCTPVKGTFKGPAKQQLAIYVSVGYEDGHVFEEVNNVKMQLHPVKPKEEALPDVLFAGQQQQ